ncbi:flavonol synthase/flavanone 3-hydroxylase-like [Corylus avellana]|uniref:flavonol synthase/flavanone 3-hydroxylase-like n=1 Tax=Corylus avellana TaxID=13451 RepID=UPI00286AB4D3|nr:flavonol synthase/flavanone 3-hydroxylase-like [Corylus avellana]
MGSSGIPIVDLSPFFRSDGDGDEGEKKKWMQVIAEACSEYGFFQIVNHGVPLNLMSRALELSTTWFQNNPDEEKLMSRAPSCLPIPAGYGRQPEHSSDKNEYLMLLPPNSGFNVYPQNPPQFKEVLEEIFSHLTRTGEVVEGILNACLGLPPEFLKKYNHDRSWDIMTAKHYFPATENENNGISEHEDGNLITFVFQDEVGGLQVLKNGDWIPVTPSQGTIIVNIGDVIQVLSNNKFKSATHRVVRKEGLSRFSYAFFYNLEGDKWVEPLPHFTKEIGEAPKYRGFQYKEYQELRIRNKTHPPSKPEDAIHITHYAI